MSRKLSSLVLLILLSQFSLSAHARDIDMPSLMALFSSSKNVRADFVERKFIKVLDAPVDSSGQLFFQAPNRLEKRTIKPRSEILIIEGNKVVIERGTFKRTVLLNDFSDMAALVQSLTATFSGDQASLEQFFKWKLTGSTNKWSLVLSPKQSNMFMALKEIRLAGDGAFVQVVETTLSDGDTSIMSLGRPSLNSSNNATQSGR